MMSFLLLFVIVVGVAGIAYGLGIMAGMKASEDGDAAELVRLEARNVELQAEIVQRNIVLLDMTTKVNALATKCTVAAHDASVEIDRLRQENSDLLEAMTGKKGKLS